MDHPINVLCKHSLILGGSLYWHRKLILITLILRWSLVVVWQLSRVTHMLNLFTSVGIRFQKKVRFKSCTSCVFFFYREIKCQLNLITRGRRYQFNIIKCSWRLSAVRMRHYGATTEWCVINAFFPSAC